LRDIIPVRNDRFPFQKGGTVSPSIRETLPFRCRSQLRGSGCSRIPTLYQSQPVQFPTSPQLIKELFAEFSANWPTQSTILAARSAPIGVRALQRLFLDALCALGRPSVPQERHTRASPRRPSEEEATGADSQKSRPRGVSFSPFAIVKISSRDRGRF
jgi:hypothetical protein